MEASNAIGRCGAILVVGCGGYAGWEENQFGLVGSYLGSQGRMAKCYRQIQKCMPNSVGGGTEPCRPGETGFVTLHLCPFEM